MATVKHFPSTANVDEVLTSLKSDGVVVIDNFVSTETIDQVLGEVGQLPGGQLFGLAGKSTTFTEQLLMAPIYMDLVKKILTDTCVIYYGKQKTVSTAEPQLSLSSAWVQEPGAAAWGLRRQDECHHTKHPAKRETDFGLVVAATNSTKDNGAIKVVVGSNQWDDVRDPKEEEEVTIELKKGDAVLCLGSVYYEVGANSTAGERSVFLGAFSTPGWCRQEENQYLAIPLEASQKFSADIQRFLGYYVSRPYGGAVEHMEPLDFLAAKGDWSKYIPVDLV